MRDRQGEKSDRQTIDKGKNGARKRWEEALKLLVWGEVLRILTNTQAPYRLYTNMRCWQDCAYCYQAPAPGRGDQLTLGNFLPFFEKRKVFTYRKSAPLPGAWGLATYVNCSLSTTNSSTRRLYNW